VVRVAALLLAIIGAVACGETSVLNVAAASSLRVVLAEAAEAGGAPTSTRIGFGGSQTGAAQVEGGARIDVVVMAGAQPLDRLVAKGLVEEPVTIGWGTLAIIVADGNPHDVRSLADLVRLSESGFVMLPAPDVPAGAAAARALHAAGLSLEPVALQRSAAGVATQVATGAADAGIAYLSDGNVEGVDAVEIDRAPAVPYRAAVVRDSSQPEKARRWLAALSHPDARAILSAAGIEPEA
jgi:molybdate transport system substrate-binding protein